MAAALTSHIDPDLSSNTPELSLGSLGSFSTTPGRAAFRVPSASSRTTAQSSAPISTPSPPSHSSFTRRKHGDDAVTSLSSRLNMLGQREREELLDADDVAPGVDVLGTPLVEKGSKKWDAPDPGPSTTSANGKKNGKAPSATSGKGVTLTLRDQEKHIDSLKKENFNIKLRVHFLEERLATLAPEQIDAALKQNISLKIEVHNRGQEVKKLKKLVLSLEHELERQQRGTGRSNRERELEERLEERERELQELRRRARSDHDDDEREDILRESEARNAELEEELENTRALLEENADEIDRLRDIVERRGDDSASMSESSGSESRRERMKRRMEELEAENGRLRDGLEDHVEALAQREDEKEDLVDEIDALRLTIEDIQRRREAENIERSESRAQILSEREEREAVEDDLNTLRDKLAAAMIELQTKEDEVEMKNREIDDLVSEHQRIVEVVEDEWRGEVEEARGQVEELKDVLAERDAESKDLRVHIAELETNSNELHGKFEAALAHLENEADQKEAEMETMRETIDKLGEQIYQLEDENDRIKEEMERFREEEGAERERLEALSAALKDKIAELKDRLQQATADYEACSEEIHAHRSRQEELASHVEDLVEEVKRERSGRERAEADIDIADKEHDAAIRAHKRTLEAKESALQSALADLARTQSLLTQREADLAAVQGALQTLEAESKRLGETHTTARFSLQLETDRLKRDLERVEDELARARKELEDKETKGRERDSNLDHLHNEHRDLMNKISQQNQTRLNLSEKFDAVSASLKLAEAEAVGLKAKVAELEGRLSKDQRSLLSAESQYRDQLTERNTLLLTIYQYLDKILGVNNTPKKGGQAETKPFTNFGVFHDNLITRLKALSQIQLDFDKRCREVEGKFADKLTDMRKQLDNRWKQIDKFEASLKTYADTKTAWKRKFSQKEGELEAIKATNSEMAAQLAGMKRPGGTDTMELRSAMTRAVNAERRLNIAQNQLATSEEKMAAMNERTVVTDSKWEARVKEYEARLKAADERVKRERQGSKERVAELENSLKSLQRQVELAQKRNNQLYDVMESAKAGGSGSPAR